MSSIRPRAALGVALVALAACTDNEPLGLEPRQPAAAPAASMAALTTDGFLAPIPINIPSLYGGYAIANDVNDRGIVVGESDQRAFVWTATGGTRELPGLVPGQSSSATGINADGWVVGQARAADGWAHAVKWSPTGVVTDLGTVPDGVDSRATGINRAGQVVGTAYRYGKDVGFIHDGATMTALLAPGQDNCEGRAINDQGVVALACASYFGGAASFRYAAGAYEVLGGLFSGDRTDVRGINGNATFVGSSYGSGRRAVIWPRTGIAQDLGGLGGDTWGVDINDAGQAVGFYMPGGIRRVVLFDPVFGNRDIGTAGNARAEPKAMNNLGDIVGTHDGLDNFFRAVLWKAISRPALDVQPGEIRLARTKTVTVYLLSNTWFDATQVDVATTLLHLNGSTTGIRVATGKGGAPATSVVDINADGRPDRAFTYNMADLKAGGLTTATTSWVLKNMTEPLTRRPFHASDATPPRVL